MGPPATQRLVALLGATLGLGMILMKVVPVVPGHFSLYEWLALVIWISVGVLLGWRGQIQRN
jgi:hypothetical protein